MGRQMADDGKERERRHVGVTRVLALWEGGQATYAFTPGQTVRVGRHRDSELEIPLPSVSRRHAVLHIGAGPVGGARSTLLDVGGMNGVTISGEKIPSHLAVPVGPGDIVELGGALLLLHPVVGSLDAGALGGPIARVAPRRPAADDASIERLLEAIGRTDLDVLVFGAPGAGKTHALMAVHAHSPRAKSALVSVAGASIDASALERAIALARSGMLVVEDVDALGGSVQEVLLRAVLDRHALDVRFAATTKADLPELVESRRFSRALYEHLAGVVIVVPTLRERAGEIARFAARFLAAVTRPGRRPPRLSSEALGRLMRHPFPRNLRELREVMEQAAARVTGGFVGPEHLSLKLGETEPPPSVVAPRGTSQKRFAPMAPTEPPDAPTDEVQVIVPPPAPTPRPVPAAKPASRRRRRS
jgi:hypothetical protein